jgi:hypothetical protein
MSTRTGKVEMPSDKMLSKTIPERSNDGICREDHRFDSVPESVIIRTWWRTLVNAYIQSKVGVCLHYHSWNVASELETRNLVIVFQKSSTGSSEIVDAAPGRDSELWTDAANPRTSDVNSPMTIFSSPIVENCKAPAEITNHQVGWNNSSVVRLYLRNDVPALLREWTNVPTALVEFSSGIDNRKVQVILVGGRVLSAIKDGSFMHTSIKGRSELIEKLAQFEAQDRGDRLEWLNPDSPCPFVLHVYDNVVNVSIGKLIPNFGEGLAVSLCPFNSLPAPIK